MSTRRRIEVEAHDVVENERGELMLVVPSQAESPTQEASLKLARNRDEAVLHRGNGKDMRLGQINADAMAKLRQVDLVVITEMDGDELRHSYFAAIEQ